MTRSRKSRGVALLSVLAIGATSMIFLLALASMVTSASRASASNKWAESLRNAAEIGIDYAVNSFNTEYPCSLDPSSSGTLVTELPDSELQAAAVNGVAPNTGIPKVKVSVKVTRLNPGQWQKLQAFCSVYSPQLDPNNSVSQSWMLPASTNLTWSSGGGLRIVESVATNGFSSRTIRVVLRARFDTQPDGTRPLESGGATPVSASYFQQPFFGNTGITIARNSSGADSASVVGLPIVDPVDSLLKPTHWNASTQDYNIYNLSVSTNRFASIGAGASVSGDVTVMSNLSGSNNVMTAVDGTVEGRALANGNVDATVSDAAEGGNVQARADAPTGVYNPSSRLGLNSSAPVVTPGSVSQYQMAPIATPSSATLLASLSAYADAGTSPTAGGDSTFQASSLSTDGIPSGKSVSFDNSASPVRIFVDQGGVETSAVNIDTSKISLTTPANYSNFQIWYEGNRPVNINMSGDFSGLVYAPNANVNITGAGNFNGAMVGRNLTVTPNSGNLTLHIDTALGKPSGGGGSGSSNALNFKYRPGEGAVIQGWQPVTWQEFGLAQ
jgi:hypothetical protein